MSVIDEVKSRLDIVDVVTDYVALQKAGRNFKARCPFHAEKTPSFVVNPERQSWHCFGACGTGGDAFTFVMRKEGLNFGDVLRLLAQKTGVDMKERSVGGDRYERLYQVNQEAADFYHKALASPEGKGAADYLSERGVDSTSTAAFQLGFSPKGRDGLKSHLFSLGFDIERGVEAGLLRRSDDGSVRDFFWGRLMFPIHDRKGRIAGFGGRTLDGSEPKYLNTAATPVFDKRGTLYGLHKALAAIRERRAVTIVEGYMDVITAHRNGDVNVVASMGTALTEQQVSQLRATGATFTLALDPDAAGQEATLRSLETTYRALERQPLGQKKLIGLRIAALPSGRDPDDLIRSDSAEWERVVREAVDYRDFLIPAIASRFDLSTPRGKAQAAEAVSPLIRSMDSAIEQDHYLEKLAQVLEVSREALEATVVRPKNVGYRRARGSSAGPQAASVSPFVEAGQDMLEEYILALLVKRPELKERASPLSPQYFHRIESREVFTSWLGCSTIDDLRGSLDESLQGYLAHLSELELAPTDPHSDEYGLDQSIRRLEQRHLQELQEGLLESDDATLPPPRELEEKIVSVNSRLKELFAQRSPASHG